MKEKTAVEWLVEEIEENIVSAIPTELVKKSKQMEKEQLWKFIKKHFVIGENTLKFYQEIFEEYWKETYERNNQSS